MEDRRTRQLVQAALFAALCCVMTMVVQIPSPLGGYVNLGDCAVLLSAWVLGPLYGAAAAGLGSMLADVFSGYAHYAPGTLVIKFTMAAVAALILRAFQKNGNATHLAARVAGAVTAEGMMVAGYFGYTGLLLGRGWGAAASVPGNLVQGVFGLVGSVALMEALTRSHALRIK